MKQALADGGVRVPHHAVASTAAEVWAAAEQVGYPLIIKPIAGAGSMDTYRCDDASEVAAAIAQLGHIETVDVEEFIDGEEFTYDTICAGGEIKYFHVGHYRPRPLIARTNEWISPQTLSYRHVDNPWVTGGIALGEQVIKVLGYDTGFTHMEWYRKSDGEVVFGEIGARPPGARTVDLMNFASNCRPLRRMGGGRNCTAPSPFPIERPFNAACITKRANGQGRIRRIEGLELLKSRLGDAICTIDLLPVGAPAPRLEEHPAVRRLCDHSPSGLGHLQGDGGYGRYPFATVCPLRPTAPSPAVARGRKLLRQCLTIGGLSATDSRLDRLCGITNVCFSEGNGCPGGDLGGGTPLALGNVEGRVETATKNFLTAGYARCRQSSMNRRSIPFAATSRSSA
ncbi:ATP-grasp domain-containing protein [Gemmatimonas sp.]|uniref:ATP-grasp domain-containing protein n=1 Tax=Gemmatimonas sp. TaxID=1962908 RepID=UPI003DA6C0EA